VLAPADEDLAEGPVLTLVGGEVQPFVADAHDGRVPATTPREMPPSPCHPEPPQS
jgi:hypothetical protein